MRWAAVVALGAAWVSCGGAGSAVRPAFSPRPLRYRVVCQAGRVCGSSVSTLTPSRALEVDFAYLDNGRGPKVHARLELAADGTPAAVQVAGTDTFGVTLDEKLTVRDGRARWKSHAEAGERALSEPAFYLPVSPLPEPIGMLTAAALRAGGKLPLLPQGEARVEKEAETTIRGRHLTVYALTGLDFQPTRVWLDDDLGFFSMVDPWGSFVLRGGRTRFVR